MDDALDGFLAVNETDDMHCWRCRTVIEMWTMLVMAREKGGGAYHLPCAVFLGWVPSDLAAASMAAAPRGPYVFA